jgi:hypothetical protein
MGEGQGKGEESRIFTKLFIPLPFTLYHMVQGSSPPVTPRREGEVLLFTRSSKMISGNILNYWPLQKAVYIFTSFLCTIEQFCTTIPSNLYEQA